MRLENHKLQQQLNKTKRELQDKNEQMEIMEYAINTIAKVSTKMLEWTTLARTYTLFLKEQWHEN